MAFFQWVFAVGQRKAKKKALCTEIQSAFYWIGGTSGGRTHDKRIKSPLLYQLSYGPFASVALHWSKTQIIALF